MSKIYNAEMQYLNVSLAKHIGINARGCVETFESDRITREACDLKPLLVYSATSPCYSVRSRYLVDAASPISISRFLTLAWSVESWMGLPLNLEMEPKLLSSDKGFVEWATSQGVACEAARSGKSIRAFARSSQDLSFAITFDARQSHSNKPPTLEAANKSLCSYDTLSISHSFGIRKSMEHLTFEAWMGRERSFSSGSHMNDDWDPTCIVEAAGALPKPELTLLRSDPVDPFFVDGLKQLAAMWPGGRSAFLRGTRCSASDFDHWAAGRANLTQQAQADVLARATATYDLDIGEHVLDGGNLLVGRAPKEVERLYEILSHGGDLEYAFEILAPAGKELPHRVLVFAAWGGFTNMVLIPRDGGKLERLLDHQTLINQGSSRNAPGDVWAAVVAIYEQRESFAEPQKVGLAFGGQFGKWLEKKANTY